MEAIGSAMRSADPAVLTWTAPASLTTATAGNIIATARSPGGAVLHVLLAAGGGTAAADASPLLAAFDRMTEKGYGIEAIARELNATVRRDPGRRFVAATLAAVDFGEGVVRVWNGGGAAPVLIGAVAAGAGADAAASRTFARSHAPLGVRSDEDLDDAVDIHSFADGSQLFLCSEGVIDAANAAGSRFGQARYVRTLEQTAAAQRLHALGAAVNSHLDGRAADDAISVLMVECRRLAAPALPEFAPSSPKALAMGAWRTTLRLSAAEIRRVDAVPMLLGLADQFEDARGSTDRLFVVLSELYNNALDHGLLRLDSALKLAPAGMEGFLNERQARLAALTRGEVELELEQLAGPDGAWLRVVCRDSGPGFAHTALGAAATDSGERPFGRGLMLVRAMCAAVSFNAAGNEVTVMLPLAGCDRNV